MNRRQFNKSILATALVAAAAPALSAGVTSPACYKWEVHMRQREFASLYHGHNYRKVKLALLPKEYELTWLTDTDCVLLTNDHHLPHQTRIYAMRIYNHEDGTCVKDRTGMHPYYDRVYNIDVQGNLKNQDVWFVQNGKRL
tara:strand:+ start:2648 stop:3070 length:423 start_codon:yes stop_codon:yes gene_type:complete